jgi:ParB family chromosome partitioning protein
LALEQKRLGRGLDALLASYPAGAEEAADSGPAEFGRRMVPVALVERNRRNPRRDFPPEQLDELAASIRQHGIIQPIVVRPLPGPSERYEIIAGERRWRAAQLAELHEVPVAVLDVPDREALELAIVENVQRADLNPIEEARGYQALIEEFHYGQADLGTKIGKSRVHVTNTLRLLKLPKSVLTMMQSGALSAGHGRALLSALDPEQLAKTVLEKNLSVRETERLAQAPTDDAPRPRPKRKAVKDADTVALERELTNHIGTKVEIKDLGEGHGSLIVHYRSLEQLDWLCKKVRS